MRAAAGHQPRSDRETENPEKLRSEHQSRREQKAADRREPRGAFRSRPSRTTGEEHEREHEPREDGSEQDQTEPSAEPKRRGKDDLSQPLLIEPGPAVRSGGKDIRPKDRVRVEHDVAGAEVVGQVDREERSPGHHENGDENRHRRPDLREPDRPHAEPESLGGTRDRRSRHSLWAAHANPNRQAFGATEAHTAVLRRTSYAEQVEVGIATPQAHPPPFR